MERSRPVWIIGSPRFSANGDLHCLDFFDRDLDLGHVLGGITVLSFRSLQIDFPVGTGDAVAVRFDPLDQLAVGLG